MRRGTTPLVSLVVYGYDLTDCAVYATIRQGTNIITKTGEALTIEAVGNDTAVTFGLTQQDTLGLTKGKANVQIRWIDADGVALATDIADIQIDGILLEGEIAYE